MNASEIRQSFLDFFEQRGHKIVSSAPVAPLEDPTLLFTNAGMNQFKDVFLGTGTRPYKRAVDSQKCIRVSGKHNDLEEVGHDTYHHTFFEMLGNWSFGDYYKDEAIAWAWELITKVWGMPKDRLWATVFSEDGEAEKLWKQATDILHSHILRFGEKENFWEMGETGPCGPCSEIHIDRGEGFCDRGGDSGHVCRVNGGCARFIELWNLVFIQYNRAVQKLRPLPAKHVDTGMGFERVVAVLQNRASNYETDLFTPILDAVGEISGKSHKEPALLPAFRVIADHVRALSFAVTDGVLPSNEGRGYVLRRLLRRACRYGRRLGMHEPFIYQLVSVLADIMGGAYPEIVKRAQHTTMVIKSEEEKFNEVLDRGIQLFETIALEPMIVKGEKEEDIHRGVIPGSKAFLLYDTYGFPLDLTQLMAREKGLDVDQDGFEKEMATQKERGRESHKFFHDDESAWKNLSEGKDSEFVGYAAFEADADIRKIRIQGDRVDLVLSRTPFYGESGGQTGDAGEIKGNGFTVQINDTQKQGDRIIHVGSLVDGKIPAETRVKAVVNVERRLSTARNHTATHLLHKALREVLGDHVNQAGSLVSPDRLRFDFTHFRAMTPDQIEEVERRVNDHVRKNHVVDKFSATLDEARRKGATALFGEKYGDEVRVVQIDAYSMELCGGTHLDRTGEIGAFRILFEEGVAAGVRRIEALTGTGAEQRFMDERRLIDKMKFLLRCREDEVADRMRTLFEERKELEKKLKKAQQTSSGSEIDELIQKKAVMVSGFQVVSDRIEAADVEELRYTGDKLREKLKSGVGLLGAVIGDKATLVCVVTDDLIQSRSLKAGDIVRKAAEIMGGSGGGKPHQAIAGGKDASKLDEALRGTPEIVKSFLKG
jgi:alanyl-tRNA synthetase